MAFAVSDPNGNRKRNSPCCVVHISSTHIGSIIVDFFGAISVSKRFGIHCNAACNCWTRHGLDPTCYMKKRSLRLMESFTPLASFILVRALGSVNIVLLLMRSDLVGQVMNCDASVQDSQTTQGNFHLCFAHVSCIVYIVAILESTDMSLI